jgi:hypothetical protein
MVGQLLTGYSLARLQKLENREYPHRGVVHMFNIPAKDDMS